MVNKKKILMLSDHPLSVSGVGTQSRWLIEGLINTGKYSFRCFGGAIKHDSYETVQVSPDFVIKPTNGFGDKNLLRSALAQERPDVLLLFTDPRFFIWVWEMEDEIHSVCPIAYNHLWDNPPWPEFNRVLYESTDLVNCINWPTYEMVNARYPEKTNYIPHAIPENVFTPLSNDVKRQKRLELLGSDRVDHFIALFVSRNARRKAPSDIIVSFKMFLDELEKKHGHRNATLLMHTDPLDPEGPNLHHVVDMTHMKKNVVFSKDRVTFDNMNSLYNVSDVVVNRSCFIPGTRVVVKNKGYLPIEDVSIGDYVLTHKRRWMPVIDTIKNSGVGKKMLKMSITNSNPITCTDDHKLLAIRRAELPPGFQFTSDSRSAMDYAKLTHASELCVGDYVVSAYERYDDQHSSQTISIWDVVKDDTYVRGNHKPVQTYEVVDGRITSHITVKHDHGPAELKLTEDVAYVLGNWCADGSTHSTGVAFDAKHQDKIDRYVRAVEAGFNVKTALNKRHNCVIVGMRNGAVLSKFFTTLCGEYSHGKQVPDCIKSADKSIQAAYIAGYIAGDGCVLTHPQYGHLTNRIRTVSNKMAFDLRQMLINLGYCPNLYEASNAHGYNKKGRIWTLEWRDRVGDNESNGSCRSWNVNGVIISRIHKIVSAPSVEFVYDLTVDVDHTYMVENVTVSNCNEGFGLSVLEAKMAGLPAIAIKTGGLTRQIEDHETKEQFGVALEPDVRSLVGNQMIPYIYEDFVSHENVANAFMTVYEWGPEKRSAVGARAREHAIKNYNMKTLIGEWDRTLTELCSTWKSNYRPWSVTKL